MLVSTSRLESRSLDPKAKALPSAQVTHHVILLVWWTGEKEESVNDGLTETQLLQLRSNAALEQ